ncbi:MAG TPA: MoxR family ATPase, partial [Desulfotomaculum sp.]|nr:MoxR family ATPase [Desulfotomaculum sp.]
NKLLQESLRAFYWVRSISGLQKKPSTSELLDWILALISGGILSEKIWAEMPFLGVLLKKNKDYDLVLQKLTSSEKQKPAASTGYGQKNW